MADTSKATIAAVVDMLNARRDQWTPDEQCREAASLISALEAERDRLRAELAKAASALLAAEKRVREECAAYMDKRGDELEASSSTHIGRVMANMYRAEAAALRKGGEHA